VSVGAARRMRGRVSDDWGAAHSSPTLAQVELDSSWQVGRRGTWSSAAAPGGPIAAVVRSLVTEPKPDFPWVSADISPPAHARSEIKARWLKTLLEAFTTGFRTPYHPPHNSPTRPRPQRWVPICPLPGWLPPCRPALLQRPPGHAARAAGARGWQMRATRAARGENARGPATRGECGDGHRPVRVRAAAPSPAAARGSPAGDPAVPRMRAKNCPPRGSRAGQGSQLVPAAAEIGRDAADQRPEPV
jgi:hypothetical protein